MNNSNNKQNSKETCRNTLQKKGHKKHLGIKVFISFITIIIITFIVIYFQERNELAEINNLIVDNDNIQKKIKVYQDYQSKKFILPFLSQKYELEKTYKKVILDDIKRLIEEDLKKFKLMNTETLDSQRKKILLEKNLNEKLNTYYEYTDNHQELYLFLKNIENNLKEIMNEMINSIERELSNSNNLVSLEKNINFYNLLSSEYKHEYLFNDVLYKTAVERMNDIRLVKEYEEVINASKLNIEVIKDGLVIYNKINTELYKEIQLNSLLNLYQKKLVEEINDFDFNSCEGFKKKYYEDFRDSVLFEHINRIWIVKKINERIKNKIQPMIKEKISNDITEYDNTLSYIILKDLYSSLLEYKKDFPYSIDFNPELLKVEDLLKAYKSLLLEVRVNSKLEFEKIEVRCNLNNSIISKQFVEDTVLFIIECSLKEITEVIELVFLVDNNHVFETQITPPFIRNLEINFNGRNLSVNVISKNYFDLTIK